MRRSYSVRGWDDNSGVHTTYSCKFTRGFVTKFRVHVNDSWFRNLKLTSSFETSTKSYGSCDKLWAMGGPTWSYGRVNAQTLRFCQLEVTSDLSNRSALPGHASLACIYTVARVCIFHVHMIVWAEGRMRSVHLSTSDFNDSLIYL